MKKLLMLISVLTGLLCLVLIVPHAVYAAEEVPINSSNFPDDTFRQYVKDHFDANKDNSLSTAEAADAQIADDLSSLGITSLKGIEYLTSLKYLTCENNQLTSLDVSANTNLVSLWCSGNQITELNLKNCTELLTLSCTGNKLTALDLSRNTKLKNLFCGSNRISSLNLTNNTALKVLNCSSSRLTALNLYYNTQLEYLSCDDNAITALDVSNNKVLTDLYCWKCRLQELDTGSNAQLERLDCGRNFISSLDLSNNKKLKELKCDTNSLTVLNVTSNVQLQSLICSFNQIAELNVSKCQDLRSLDVRENRLKALDISCNAELVYFSACINQIAELDISRCPVLLLLYRSGSREEDQTGGVHYEDHNADYSQTYWLEYDLTTQIVTAGENPFLDVNTSDTFYNAVVWAAKNKITSGTSETTFSPGVSCTRYQFAVMLYKLYGKPDAGSVTIPFSDVDPGASYYKAVAWAYKNKLISGTSQTTFSPNAAVTRYQVVQVLYKTAGRPAAAASNPFSDVPESASYRNAVLWAVEKGITKGTSATTFSPDAACKRYQMVVFLKKYNDRYHIK